MEPRIISEYSYMEKGTLDHCYQLFSNGSVKYTYDTSIYPDGLNRVKELSYVDLDPKVKEKLIENASVEGQAIIIANFLQNENG